MKVVDIIQNVDDNDREKVTSIEYITSFFNFKYEESGLRVWQAYDIGKGKYIFPDNQIDNRATLFGILIKLLCN